MNSSLAAGKMRELIETLRSALEEFASRAEKLNADYHLKAARERQAGEAGIQQFTREAAAERSAIEAQGAEQKARLQTRFELRKVRIGKAYQSSKERALQKVEEDVGGRKYDLQRRMLQAERDRETSIAATHKHFQEFRTGLAGEQQRLAELERGAQSAFRGYGSLKSRFLRAYEQTPVGLEGGEEALLERLRQSMSEAEKDLWRFRRMVFVQLFKPWPLWLVLAVAAVAGAPLLPKLGVTGYGYHEGAVVAVGMVVGVVLLRWVALRFASAPSRSISERLAAARHLHDACAQKCEAHYQSELERIGNEFAATTQDSDQQLKKSIAEAGHRRVACRLKADERTVRVHHRNEAWLQSALKRLELSQTDSLATFDRAVRVKETALRRALDEKLGRLEQSHQRAWEALQSEWNSRVQPAYSSIQAARQEVEKLFPPWNEVLGRPWSPPANFVRLARAGTLQVDLAKLCSAMPKDRRLALPGPAQFEAPLCLAYPEAGSILIETSGTGQEQAIASLNNLVLRVLEKSPPGKANFTIIDPVGLGQNFAGIMHLADYEEQLINNRIWTQGSQIEQRLADLNEHMEKVIQMYLRNEYQTIAEYNEQAGVIAEKYHFLVVADFPAAFSDTAAKRLLSIAASGARCGVFTLIHWDRRQPLPQDFIPDELRKSSVCLTVKGSETQWTDRHPAGIEIRLEFPPGPEDATRFIQEIGKASRDSTRVEVPFEHVAPAEAEMWSETTSAELRVAIGRTGATKLQYLEIGKGTCQHALVAGKTGSGKSTLFHVMITNLALWCSPEQVEFYLVDFKKGVEFKCYATRRLPHARVVAIESDREFGLSVLQRVDEELRRRGDLFRQLGVQDVAGYQKAGGAEPMPRTLLIVDEFQEFFVEDDKTAQTASLLLDRIVRQGRAFGIHVVLGSQTLGGAYTVARTTLGQMVIRIALQCNEADAYLIMDENNPAPRLLSRPGEGIYNDMAGALEGNSPFQVVWLNEATRDHYLERVRARADQTSAKNSVPIVFEGNAPADARENLPLLNLVRTRAAKAPAAGRIWLGAPNSIKGPTEVVFHRQGGNNLLVVGQRDEAVLAMFSLALVSLAAQFPSGAARLLLLDSTPPDTPHRQYLERLLDALRGRVELIRPGDLDSVMAGLDAELRRRTEDPNADAAPPVFLFVNGLQKFGRLKHEEDFGFGSTDAETPPAPGAVLSRLASEGTRLGFHVVASCDTYNNVNRFFSRKVLSEFELRVLFQMSVNDSASLIDNPRAGMLGLHRALLFNAQEGYLETFRPYALPPADWIEQAATRVAS